MSKRTWASYSYRVTDYVYSLKLLSFDSLFPKAACARQQALCCTWVLAALRKRGAYSAWIVGCHMNSHVTWVLWHDLCSNIEMPLRLHAYLSRDVNGEFLLRLGSYPRSRKEDFSSSLSSQISLRIVSSLSPWRFPSPCKFLTKLAIDQQPIDRWTRISTHHN